ncbi:MULTISPECIES: hypothetical protein [Vibrio]|uniref:Uncharacterized protein n=1 Tax=Vibrio coralliilyticus TaxID=190893 RepID=A0AAP7DDQ0_9VIBR|nr:MULTISPECIES: hypothetical protein [Vibrio]EEX34584.1 hypothetical protein VIC_001384 [Vibrio coralliilyticus ATCC BAA-450]MDE3898628.1 hypothetical protein [Vibrio sp. CC007]NOJ24248.1 hypothetical protein [Vibrio coralliilyticus]
MKYGLFVLLIFISNQICAQPRYLCKNENTERVIEVVRDDVEALVPCEVRYTKGSKTETLWVAQHEVGYCEEKAQLLADKLTNIGLHCVLEEGMSIDFSAKELF